MSRFKPAFMAAVMLGALYGGDVRTYEQPVPRPTPEPPEPASSRRSRGPLTDEQVRAMAEHERKCIKGNKRKGKR